MNNNTMTEALAAAAIEAAALAAAANAAEKAVPTTAAESLSDIDDGLEALAEEMAALRAKRVAMLPRISTKEREFLIKVESRVERTEAAMKKAGEIKKARSMTEEDKDQVSAARLEHKRVINEDAVKAEAAEYVKMAYLHSYKLTHRKDGKLGLAIRGIV
jgi:hypothetical protein